MANVVQSRQVQGHSFRQNKPNAIERKQLIKVDKEKDLGEMVHKSLKPGVQVANLHPVVQGLDPVLLLVPGAGHPGY